MDVGVEEMLLDNWRYFTWLLRDLTKSRKAETRSQDLQTGLAHSRGSPQWGSDDKYRDELNPLPSAVASYIRASVKHFRVMVRIDRVALRELLSKAATQTLRSGQITPRLREFIAHRKRERRPENLPHTIEQSASP